jgi:hypothetical protein
MNCTDSTTGISDVWVGVIGGIAGTLIGVLITYWIEEKRHVKREKVRRLERMIAVRSSLEGFLVMVFRSAINTMTYSFGMNFMTRKRDNLKAQNLNSGPDWEYTRNTAKENAETFKEELDKYFDTVAQCHALLVEFEYYLPKGEKFDFKMWGKFTPNKFDFLKTMPIDEFNKIDNKVMVKKIHEEYLKELESYIVPIMKRVKERIGEEETKLKK